MQNNRLSLPPLIRHKTFDPSKYNDDIVYPKWNKNIVNNDSPIIQSRNHTKIKGTKYDGSLRKNGRVQIQLKSLSNSTCKSANHQLRKNLNKHLSLRELSVPPPIDEIGSGSVKRSKRSRKKRSKNKSSIRRKKRISKAAICIQKFIRGVLARILFRLLQRRLLFRLAAKSGVLLVCADMPNFFIQICLQVHFHSFFRHAQIQYRESLVGINRMRLVLLCTMKSINLENGN